MVDWLFQNTPLYLMTQSFWTDEGFSYLISRLPILVLLKRAAADFNPPLYYLLLHFWMKFLGTSEVVMRSLSLFIFVATAYVFFLFIENIFKIHHWRKWLYLIVFISNPFLLYYACVARMYALFALLAMLSYYFFIRKDYRWYGVVAFLGLYTHYFFGLVILTQLIYSIWLSPTRLKTVLRALFMPAILSLPWLGFNLPQLLSHIKETWIMPMTLSKLLTSFGALYTGYEPDYWSYYDRFIGPISMVILLIGVAVLINIKTTKKPDRLLALLFLWSFGFYVGLALFSFIKPVFVPRYLIFAPAGFTLLLVYLLEKFANKKALLLSVLLVLITIHYYHYQIEAKEKADIRATIQQIKRLARPTDAIYVPDAAMYFTAAYYFGEKPVYVYARPEEVPYYVGLALIPKQKIRLELPIFPQKAFILRGKDDYQVLTVM